MICKKHPKYKAILYPYSNCKVCVKIYEDRLNNDYIGIMEERGAPKKILRAMKPASNKGKRKNMTKTNTYKLISPSGKIYSTDNLTKFANRFKNLTRTGLSKVVNGHQSTHKGWRAA